MKTTPISNSTKPATNPTPEQLDSIRVRAYELYEQRGRDDGHDIDDWLQAESEITNVRTKRVAA